jgi:outer membrane protein assembly factor BamB
MKRFALLCALLALGSCSRKEKDVDAPARLVDFPATLQVDRVWQAAVSSKDAELRLSIGLAADDGKAFAAGSGGEVAAFDLKSGRTLWKTRIRGTLSAGTGAGQGLVVVATNKGEVIALDAANGAVRWRARAGGEVLAAPAVASAVVAVRTVDGKLHGLAVANGKQSWVVEQPMPRLTLRGTARPVVAGDMVLSGFDNGKVVAVNQADGAVLWEATVSPPKGRTELERLVDIDSAVHVIGQDVYVVGFQGRAALLALEGGQVWWARDLSSYRGLDVDADNIYVATAAGEVAALARRTGIELWRQSALIRRGLSAPAVTGAAVAVGDFEGYVHWLDRATGAIIGRTKLGGRISAQPLAVGELLLVESDSGRIAAYRANRRGGSDPAAAPAAAKSP